MERDCDMSKWSLPLFHYIKVVTKCQVVIETVVHIQSARLIEPGGGELAENI